MHAGVTKTVHDEGMPRSGGGRGDLIIRFDVSFPDSLTFDQKAALKKVLPSSATCC